MTKCASRWALPVLLGLGIAPLFAAPLDLETIMQNPDWIGPPVEGAYLSLDGSTAFFELKIPGSELRDLYQVKLAGGSIEPVSAAAHALIDGSQAELNAAGTLAVFVRAGDVFVRELQTGTLRQLTRSSETDEQPRFALDGRVQFKTGLQWSVADLSSGAVGLVAPLIFAADPLDPDPSALESQQLALIYTLNEQETQAKRARERELAQAQSDPSRAAAPIYLSKDEQLVDSYLSASGAHLLVVTQKAGELEPGEGDQLASYVTRSGYVEIEALRTLVGADAPVAQRLRLIALDTHAVTEIKFDALAGIFADPLAELKLKAGLKKPRKPHKRGLSVEGAEFSPDATRLVVQLRSIDNKDRWLASVSLSSGALKLEHRLTDAAWINFNFNDFGWLKDSRTLWFLSEESNFSQLYVKAQGSRPRALTSGAFEIRQPKLNAQGSQIYFTANRINSGRYEVYRVSTAGGEIEQLTALGGENSFVLSQDETQLLVTHSKSYLPPQLVAQTIGGESRRLTDTRTLKFKDVNWQQPSFVAIPSTHFKGQVTAKLYLPSGPVVKPRAAVVFVHGAGYTQDVHEGYPYYFREQMFHNLLSQQGVVVLAPDYRASEGYGRDFRTAIYRQMGTPELEDLKDAVAWLSREHAVDPQRVGVYGGSYGGFMTLMALFKAPDLFAAGAALRPVTDWAHYNHGYTANILNTPDIDAKAYRDASPIEWAQGLTKPLLITHGMLDDNVFFKDSVRLSQRLIELKKENWELAAYPLERHSYLYADAWLDQYRRIYQLFRRELKFAPLP